MNSKKPISTIIMLLALTIFINIFSYLNNLFSNCSSSSHAPSEYEQSQITPYMNDYPEKN